jgi:hypothetical protein
MMKDKINPPVIFSASLKNPNMNEVSDSQRVCLNSLCVNAAFQTWSSFYLVSTDFPLSLPSSLRMDNTKN